MSTAVNHSEFNYSPAQVRIFRAVVGAVKNAADGHPKKWKFDKTFARSIAKRATGTLVSQWPELGAPPPSDRAESLRPDSQPRTAATLPRGRCARGVSVGAKSSKRRPRRSPLKFLHNRIGNMAGAAKHAGQTERFEALRDVLRLIGAERERLGASS